MARVLVGVGLLLTLALLIVIGVLEPADALNVLRVLSRF